MGLQNVNINTVFCIMNEIIIAQIKMAGLLRFQTQILFFLSWCCASFVITKRSLFFLPCKSKM